MKEFIETMGGTMISLHEHGACKLAVFTLFGLYYELWTFRGRVHITAIDGEDAGRTEDIGAVSEMGVAL